MEDMTSEDQNWYFAQLRQGDIFNVEQPDGTDGLFPDGTESAVIVSQTCDIVQPKRPTVTLAAVAQPPENQARTALRGDNPRFVPLPKLGQSLFVDLAYIHTFDKKQLAGRATVSGIDPADDDAVRSFAIAIGRWFSRFAFPDEVVPWLDPLLTTIRHKYDKPGSALGRALADVVEFRVEAENWTVRPLDLTLHIIVGAGALPTLDDDMLPADPNRAVGPARTPPQVAEELSAAVSPRDRTALWEALAMSMAASCSPKEGLRGDPAVMTAVRKVVPMLWSDDEFPLARWRKSEILDVDYLSGSVPL
jgi:hypothetical protein